MPESDSSYSGPTDAQDGPLADEGDDQGQQQPQGQQSAQGGQQGAPKAPPAPKDTSTENPSGQNTVRDPVTGRWTSPAGLQAAQEEREAKKQQEAQATAERKLKVKVRGREMELSEAEIRTHLEVGLGGKEVFTEADRKLKEYDARMAAFAEDPASVMLAHGIDPHQFALAYMNSQTEYAAMSAPERALYDREQELAAREAEVEAHRQEQERLAYEQDQAEQLEVLTQYLPVALQNMGLPSDRRTLALVMPYLKQAEAAGQRMTPEVIGRAASFARMDMDEHVAGALSSLDGEALIQALGPAIVRKVRLYDLSLAKKGPQGRPGSNQVRSAPTQDPRPEPKVTKPMTEMEWRRAQREAEERG